MRSLVKVLIALVPVIPAALIAVACSSSNNTSGGSGGETCTSNAQCSTGTVCAYDDSTGCGTQGTCQVPAANPPAFSACGCNGQPVAYVTSGYTASPVLSSEPCDDAGPSEDAGHDSGTDSSVAEGGSEAGATSEAGAEGGTDAGDAGSSELSDAGDASDGA